MSNGRKMPPKKLREKMDDSEKGQKKQPPKSASGKPAKRVRHKAVAERAAQEVPVYAVDETVPVPGPSTDINDDAEIRPCPAVERRPHAAKQGLQEVPVSAIDKPQNIQPAVPIIERAQQKAAAQGQPQKEVEVFVADPIPEPNAAEIQPAPIVGRRRHKAGAQQTPQQEVPVFAADAPNLIPEPNAVDNAAEMQLAPIVGRKRHKAGAQGVPQQEVPAFAADAPNPNAADNAADMQPAPVVGRIRHRAGAQGAPQQEVPAFAADAPNPNAADNAAEMQPAPAVGRRRHRAGAQEASNEELAHQGIPEQLGAGVQNRWSAIQKPTQVDEEDENSKELGKGGYGRVYHAYDKDKNECAIKVQKHMEQAITEREVLRAYRNSEVAKTWKPRRYPIFYKLIKWADQFDIKPAWIVIELLGKTLFQIQSGCTEQMHAKKRFSIPTVYGVMVQCIQAIEQLHEIGFIHRDLSPANFAVGKVPPNNRVIYVFDFGLCRRYCDDDGQIIPTEDYVTDFVGTPMYCSTAAHLGEQQYRRDDFKALIYVFWEMITGKLLWDNTDTAAILNEKRKWFPSFSKSMLTEIQTFFGYIEKLEPDDRPPYEDMCERFRDLIQQNTAEHTRDECKIDYEWLRAQGCHGLKHWEMPRIAGPSSPISGPSNI